MVDLCKTSSKPIGPGQYTPTHWLGSCFVRQWYTAFMGMYECGFPHLGRNTSSSLLWPKGKYFCRRNLVAHWYNILSFRLLHYSLSVWRVGRIDQLAAQLPGYIHQCGTYSIVHTLLLFFLLALSPGRVFVWQGAGPPD